ncbi:MAG TPA: hypothetical protein VEL76_31435 [Gemmataceae bacterium]|nr:hypothetical protein [Gemmataceae bacterium]
MRCLGLIMFLGTASVGGAQELAKLPANTWVEVKYTTVQPADPGEKGRWVSAGWNKLVYDPDGKRVLFYDRWHDKKHGGTTIYGNCLFAFDPAGSRLTPLKIDHWKRIDTKTGGYRTVPLPENVAEPAPASRHVYHAFDYVPELKSVFLCNGANQTVMKNEKLVGHDECDGAWRLDLKTNQWTQIKAKPYPPNRLDDAMAYCPDIKALVYSGYDGQLWLLDLAGAGWRKARQSPPPRTAFGRTVCYDPTRKRMLLLGGGRLDGWQKGKALEFRELYAFDPRAETVERLADGPTAFSEAQLAYDSRREVFVTVAVFNKQEQPSGMFGYDPKKNAWHEIKPANAIPPHTGWHGWMKLCHAADHDCFLGVIRDRIYAFRYEPAR